MDTDREIAARQKQEMKERLLKPAPEPFETHRKEMLKQSAPGPTQAQAAPGTPSSQQLKSALAPASPAPGHRRNRPRQGQFRPDRKRPLVQREQLPPPSQQQLREAEPAPYGTEVGDGRGQQMALLTISFCRKRPAAPPAYWPSFLKPTGWWNMIKSFIL